MYGVLLDWDKSQMRWFTLQNGLHIHMKDEYDLYLAQGYRHDLSFEKLEENYSDLAKGSVNVTCEEYTKIRRKMRDYVCYMNSRIRDNMYTKLVDIYESDKQLTNPLSAGTESVESRLRKLFLEESWVIF